MAVNWSPELLADVRRLFDGGMTTAGIAASLGQGLTKGSVVGKLHRIGALRKLGERSPSPRKPVPRTVDRESRPRAPDARREAVERARTPSPIVHPLPKAPFTDTGHLGIGMMELSASTCRWPFKGAGVSPATYCGAGVVSGSPYCDCHSRIAYRPARRP